MGNKPFNIEEVTKKLVDVLKNVKNLIIFREQIMLQQCLQ
jgi:hypothetical protein